MSSDRCLSLSMFLTLSLVLALTISEATPSTVWVAPTEGECQERAPCGTLQDLWLSKPGVNIINESNTTWVFLPGSHLVNCTAGNSVTFLHVSNIALLGDESCTVKGSECTIVCTSYLCVFFFIESFNITIRHLTVLYKNTSYLPMPEYSKEDEMFSDTTFYHYKFHHGYLAGVCNESSFHLRLTSWMFVVARDVHIDSLYLVGYNSQITVYNPGGLFEITACEFSQLPPATTQQSALKSCLAIIVSHTAYVAENVYVLVARCTFMAPRYFPSANSSNLNEKFYNHHAVLVSVNRSDHALLHSVFAASTGGTTNVNITVESCDFLNTSGIDIELSDNVLQQTIILVENCTMNGGVVRERPWGFLLIEGSGVKILVVTGFRDSLPDPTLFGDIRSNASGMTPTSQVVIHNNKFHNLSSVEGIGIALQFKNIGQADPCSCNVQVLIEQNCFYFNWGLNYASVIDASHMWLNGSSESQVCVYTRPAVSVSGNEFKENRAEFSRCLGFVNGTDNTSAGYVHLFRRWDIWEECRARDVGKGVIHFSNFKNSYFATFVNNCIEDNLAMGLSLINSHVVFNGSSVVSQNYAPFGGGIFMGDGALMLLVNGTNLDVKENLAAFSGGGIFVSPINPQIKSTQSVMHLPTAHCFFDFVTNSGELARNISLADLNISVNLLNNTAVFSGSSLFVSELRHCAPPSNFLIPSNPLEVFRHVFHLPSYATENEFASFPQKICICDPSMDGRIINCSLQYMQPLLVYPGQSLDLWLIVLGEANVTLRGHMAVTLLNGSVGDFSSFNSFLSNIPKLVHVQTLVATCDKVTIPPDLMTVAGKYILMYAVPFLRNTPMDDSRAALMTLQSMTVLGHCPLGYNLINDSAKLACQCHRALEHNDITCVWKTFSFVLPPRHWIGAGSTNTSLLFSDYCLPAYCRDVYMSKEVFLSNLTHQCLHGRVGTLCGECPEGQSVMLGSYNCMACSYYGLLVVALFLVAGPFVIALICFLNWTVAARSSNGLLLYLNVVSINSDLLLSSNSFAFAVISWLNFQMGIEICLFDGMDEFAKTAIGFAFPLYLLSLVALIVMVSKCINMHRINKLIGPRITPVLATVIFFSYTMLSDSVLKSLLFASLCNTDGGCHSVWLLDGSLKYFRSTKHLILACIALTVLFVLLIPITLIAVIGDLFRRCISNRWYMNFLDTFHSSYRFRWGFWMGVRLMLRVVLLLLKVTVKPEVVWLVTACFSLSLAAAESVLKPFRHLRFDRFTHRLVERWCSSDENGRTVANYLDISFLVNLTALFLCISYLPDSAEVFISLSLCVALLELLLILAYHLVEYSPLWPPLLRATTRMADRVMVFVQTMRNSEEQQLGDEETNHVLLNLPLVLRADDCQDEDYESSSEEQEDTDNEKEVAEQSHHTD